MSVVELLMWVVVLAFVTAFNPLLGVLVLLALLYTLGKKGS